MNAWKERLCWLIGNKTVYFFVKVTEPMIYIAVGFLLGKVF